MLRAGLIGLPSSGKTTLFELLTSVHEAPRTQGKAEANVGVSRVPDDRLDQLTAMFQPKKRVPATVEFADMAAGRGDAKSLVDVVAYRNADALLHVVRAFRDPAVPHPHTSVDPARDVRLVEDELILADLGSVERRLERLEKDLKKNPSADLKAEQELLVRGRATLDAGRALRTLGLSAADARRLRGFQFLSAKPLLLVVNLDEADLAHASQAATHAGLDRVIRAAYDLLGYMSFFTVGEDECRAWSIPRHTRAQDAAGAIHSDIQRGFIRAEVVPWDTLISRGSLAACRDHGELRLEGKDYVVLDGDTINFRHAT